MFSKYVVGITFTIESNMAPRQWETRFPRITVWRLRRLGFCTGRFLGCKSIIWVPPSQILRVQFNRL